MNRLCKFASWIYGGLKILLGESYQMSFLRDCPIAPPVMASSVRTGGQTSHLELEAAPRGKPCDCES